MEKESGETQGHLEKIPGSTQRISQMVSPKGVPSYGVISPWAMFSLWKKVRLSKMPVVLVTAS